MTKQCRICGNEFEIINKNAHCRQYCYKCVPNILRPQDQTNARRHAIKQQAIEILGSKCMKCGEDKTYMLDCHHMNVQEKEKNVSQLLTHVKIEAFFLEIQKCILLCANCHREFHYLHRLTGLSTEDFVDLTNFNPSFPNSDRTYQFINANGLPTQYTYICIKCKQEIKRTYKNSDTEAGMCRTCTDILRRTCPRPSKEQLLQELTDKNFCAVGAKYRVTDNAIRKWCKVYGLPTHSQYYRDLKKHGAPRGS